MRNKIVLFLFGLLLYTNISAQNTFEYFPSGLNIQPFTANIIEPRIGFMFQSSKNELRLDIGNSMDIIRYGDKNKALSFGADFFTFTLLRGENDFHFPVDAVDYLFGVNFGYKKVVNQTDEFGVRLRLSHISAHFADGHFNNAKQEWRDGQKPRVYSREFLEFIPYYKFNDLRLYGGFTYIYHIDPTNIGKYNFHAGFDYFQDDFFINMIHPFIGYDLRAIKISKYSVNNSIEVGIKAGHNRGRGISLYYTYFSGNNIHGEYFNFREKYHGIGINLDL
jgi:hypothetical protein